MVTIFKFKRKTLVEILATFASLKITPTPTQKKTHENSKKQTNKSKKTHPQLSWQVTPWPSSPDYDQYWCRLHEHLNNWPYGELPDHGHNQHLRPWSQDQDQVDPPWPGRLLSGCSFVICLFQQHVTSPVPPLQKKKLLHLGTWKQKREVNETCWFCQS